MPPHTTSPAGAAGTPGRNTGRDHPPAARTPPPRGAGIPDKGEPTRATDRTPPLAAARVHTRPPSLNQGAQTPRARGWTRIGCPGTTPFTDSDVHARQSHDGPRARAPKPGPRSGAPRRPPRICRFPRRAPQQPVVHARTIPRHHGTGRRAAPQCPARTRTGPAPQPSPGKPDTQRPNTQCGRPNVVGRTPCGSRSPHQRPRHGPARGGAVPEAEEAHPRTADPTTSPTTADVHAGAAALRTCTTPKQGCPVPGERPDSPARQPTFTPGARNGAPGGAQATKRNGTQRNAGATRPGHRPHNTRYSTRCARPGPPGGQGSAGTGPGSRPGHRDRHAPAAAGVHAGAATRHESSGTKLGAARPGRPTRQHPRAHPASPHGHDPGTRDPGHRSPHSRLTRPRTSDRPPPDGSPHPYQAPAPETRGRRHRTQGRPDPAAPAWQHPWRQQKCTPAEWGCGGVTGHEPRGAEAGRAPVPGPPHAPEPPRSSPCRRTATSTQTGTDERAQPKGGGDGNPAAAGGSAGVRDLSALRTRRPRA